MFAASVIICAVVNGMPNQDLCMGFGDSWGPYELEETCLERADEMLNFLQNDPIARNAIVSRLGNQVATLAYCEEETPPGELT